MDFQCLFGVDSTFNQENIFEKINIQSYYVIENPIRLMKKIMKLGIKYNGFYVKFIDVHKFI